MHLLERRPTNSNSFPTISHYCTALAEGVWQYWADGREICISTAQPGRLKVVSGPARHVPRTRPRCSIAGMTYRMERSDRDIPPESDSFQRGWAIICGVLGEPFSAEGPQGPREEVDVGLLDQGLHFDTKTKAEDRARQGPGARREGKHSAAARRVEL
jgi:hypothetical protein